MVIGTVVLAAIASVPVRSVTELPLGAMSVPARANRSRTSDAGPLPFQDWIGRER